MKGMLYEAAQKGDVQFLLELLGQDPLILDRVITGCVNMETPLHVAAMLGHLDFVKEILQKKPELVRELDSQKSSPLHLASAKGDVEIVKELLAVGSYMCLVCDAEGRNPFRLAAMKGHVEVLKELANANSDAVWATMGFGETILHICVKYRQLRALELLVDVLGDDHQLLNAKDDYGLTILHHAVIDKQIEILDFLLMNTKIEVNAPSANGFTALDILTQSKRDLKDYEIGESLRSAGAIHSSPPQQTRKHKHNNLLFPNPKVELAKIRSMTNPQIRSKKIKEEDWLIKKREALMVVASLIATMGFQAVISPPSGLWQDDDDGHMAGSSIMASKHKQLYPIYLCCNTIGFIASLSIILLLITGLPFFRRFFMWLLTLIMWIAITSMALTYIITIMVTTREADNKAYSFDIFGWKIHGTAPKGTVSYVLALAIVAWIGLMALILLVHTIHLTFLFIKGFVKLVEPRRKQLPIVSAY